MHPYSYTMAINKYMLRLELYFNRSLKIFFRLTSLFLSHWSSEDKWVWILTEYIICITTGLSLWQTLLVLTDSLLLLPGREGDLTPFPMQLCEIWHGFWWWNRNRREVHTFRFSCLNNPPWYPVPLRVSTKHWIWFKRLFGICPPSPLHLFCISCLVVCLSYPVSLTIGSSFKWQPLPPSRPLWPPKHCFNDLPVSSCTVFHRFLIMVPLTSYGKFFLACLLPHWVICSSRADRYIIVHSFNTYFQL